MNNNTENLDFITTEEYTKEDVKKVQQVSKELMSIIVNIFDKNNIDYIVAHGTLLGLIRHKGHFIPWDDDCDLFVFDWCYARAIEILRRELPDDLIVHNRRNDPIYWISWTKIRDTHSDTYESFWTIDRKLKYHGICIDLLKVTTCRWGKWNVERFYKKLNKRSKTFYDSLSGQKGTAKKLKILMHKVGSVFYYGWACFLKAFAIIDRRKVFVANKDTVIEGHFSPKDVFPIKKYQFEGVSVSGPNNPDGVLKALYGDYMRIPPVEKRLPHFSKVEFFD